MRVEVFEDLVLKDEAVSLYEHPAIARIVSEADALTVHLVEDDSFALKPNEVVVGQSESEVFLRRVTAVERRSPRELHLQTEGARLEDFFAEGAFRVTGNPLTLEVPEAAPLLRSDAPQRIGHLPLIDEFRPLGEACDTEKEANLDIRPNFSMSPFFSFEANFSGGEGGRHLRAELGVKVGAAITAEATGKVSFSCSLERRLKRVLRRQFFTLPTPAGPIPVMIAHRFTPTVHATISAAAEASGMIRAARRIQTSVGVDYRNGSWSPIYEAPHEPEGSLFKSGVRSETEISLSAAVGVQLHYQGLLYGLYGPYLELNPRVEGSVSVQNLCTAQAKVDAVLDGVYGFAPKRDEDEKLLDGCVDAPADWNGRPKHIAGCRCSAEVNADFEAAFRKRNYREITKLNHRPEYDVMREWYLNSRCTRGPISLGRFPDFVDEGRRLGYPFLNVPQDDMGTPDPKDDLYDWTPGVNEAWLRGAMDRRAPIYMATDPCDEDGRSYWKDPDNQAEGRPVTYDELQELMRNGYTVDREGCAAMDPPKIDVQGATIEFEFPEFSYPLLETESLDLKDNCGDDPDGDGSGGDGSGGDGSGGDGSGGDGSGGDGSGGDGSGGDGSGGSGGVGGGAEDAARAALCLLGQSLCCSEGATLTEGSDGCICGEGYQQSADGNSCITECPAGAIPDPSGTSACVCDADAGFKVDPATNNCVCDGQAGMRANDDGTACVSANCPSQYPVYDAALDKCRDSEVCVEVHATTSCVWFRSPWEIGKCLDGWGEEPNVSRYSIGEWASLPSLVQQADSFFQSCGGGCQWAKDHCFISDERGWVRHTPAIWQGRRTDGTEGEYELYESEVRGNPSAAYAPGTLAGYRNKYIGYGSGTHHNYCGVGGGHPIVSTLQDTYWCKVQPD